jgi:hypothetical protein
MQKKYRFSPLGPADGAVKASILGNNAARMYKLDLHAAQRRIGRDGITDMKAAYLKDGTGRSNLTYGYVNTT